MEKQFVNAVAGFPFSVDFMKDLAASLKEKCVRENKTHPIPKEALSMYAAWADESVLVKASEMKITKPGLFEALLDILKYSEEDTVIKEIFEIFNPVVAVEKDMGQWLGVPDYNDFKRLVMDSPSSTNPEAAQIRNSIIAITRCEYRAFLAEALEAFLQRI